MYVYIKGCFGGRELFVQKTIHFLCLLCTLERNHSEEFTQKCQQDVL